MGTPLELVKYRLDDGKFEVGQEAIDALMKVHAPVGVVAVCGRARQGKSYILNKLLKQTGSGFVVGPTHRPCTKGLWMWSEPQKRVNPDGSQHYLVLLDTEGIDAWDQTAQYSTQIFSLAVLLSSLFVYNQMGGIDESALDRLSLVTEMTKHIRVKAGGGNERLGDFTPAFLWLLRDFYLKLEEEGGRKVTAKDYLETALLPVTGAGGSADAKNAIRASIKALFPDRDCFTLVRPMNDETQLVNLDKVPAAKLRPQFKEGVDQLISRIFSKAEPKKFGSTYMTGPVLAGLVQAYVQALNAGAVPTIATAWQGVAEQESRRAAERAEQVYFEAFNLEVAAEEGPLAAEHQRCMDLALAAFVDIAVGDENIKKAHEAKFRQVVAVRFGDIKARKIAEATSTVNELLYNASQSVTQAMRSGAGLADVQAKLQAFVEEYARSASGPTKWQRLAEFLRDTYASITQELLVKSQKAGEESAVAAKAEVAAAKRDAAGANQRAEAAEARCASVDAEVARLRGELERVAREAGELRARAEMGEARYKELEAQMRDSTAVNEMKQHNAQQQAEARFRALQLDMESKSAELQAQLSAAKTKLSKMDGDTGALNIRISSLDKQLSEARQEVDAWRAKYGSAEQTLARAVQERDAAREQASGRSAEVQKLTRERMQAQDSGAAVKAELQAQNTLRLELQQRLDEMIAEAQAVREAAAMRGPAALSAALNGSMGVEHGDDAGSGARDNGDRDGDAATEMAAEALSRMTIMEIKDFLTQRGHGERVWAFQSRKPAPKKSEWVSLVHEVSTA